VHIEDPQKCGSQLRDALALDGPVVIEAVVDENEPPMPPKVTREQVKMLYDSLRRGEEQRRQIGLTIGRDAIDERTFAASPYGAVERVKDRIAHAVGRDGED
jgi:pyruvate dehydrogenase (quinone)